jgi:hypothetical protein
MVFFKLLSKSLPIFGIKFIHSWTAKTFEFILNSLEPLKPFSFLLMVFSVNYFISLLVMEYHDNSDFKAFLKRFVASSGLNGIFGALVFPGLRIT